MDFKDVVFSPINTTGEGTKKLYQSQDIERQAIRINSISAERSEYDVSRTIQSKELIKGETDRIAVYAKEYIPAHFENQNCIQYFLTINGEQHQIEPINSHRNGIKIVKSSSYIADDVYTLNINESIKSAILEIRMSTEDPRETPYISNLKIIEGSGAL